MCCKPGEGELGLGLGLREEGMLTWFGVMMNDKGNGSCLGRSMISLQKIEFVAPYFDVVESLGTARGQAGDRRQFDQINFDDVFWTPEYSEPSRLLEVSLR